MICCTRNTSTSTSTSTPNTMKTIAARAIPARLSAIFGTIFIGLGVLGMAGCALPDKPVRGKMYDFGPGPLATKAVQNAPRLPPLVISDVASGGGALDNMAVLYRLGYTNSQQLMPYASARWTTPPYQLVRLRLREQLGQQRLVFHARESSALNRDANGNLPLMLRVELLEFSQYFNTPQDSFGLVRMQVSAVDMTAGGEKIKAQRMVTVQKPAATPDAPGGVRALTEATDAAIEEINQWLQTLPPR